MSKYAAVLVFSTGHAIQAERVLTRAGFDVKLIPTPRHLSSDCGSAVRVTEKDCARATQTLADAGVEIDRVETLDE